MCGCSHRARMISTTASTTISGIYSHDSTIQGGITRCEYLPVLKDLGLGKKLIALQIQNESGGQYTWLPSICIRIVWWPQESIILAGNVTYVQRNRLQGTNTSQDVQTIIWGRRIPRDTYPIHATCGSGLQKYWRRTSTGWIAAFGLHDKLSGGERCHYGAMAWGSAWCRPWVRTRCKVYNCGSMISCIFQRSDITVGLVSCHDDRWWQVDQGGSFQRVLCSRFKYWILVSVCFWLRLYSHLHIHYRVTLPWTSKLICSSYFA